MASTLAQLLERGLGSGPLTKSIYGANQQKDVRIIATVSAGLSTLSGLLAFYWFTRMARKFRHT